MISPEVVAMPSILVAQEVKVTANPMCVWNQAYQENYEKDTYDKILQGAQNCYTLVDPFNGEVGTNTKNKISQLQSNGNNVGCYISSGTCEKWRNDYDDIKDHCVDQQWGDWDGEYFVYDIWGMLPRMKTRINQMAEWGCDYVEFDNMDWCTDTQYRKNYGSTPGQEFPSPADCANYNVDMCDHARAKGLKCMAKNTGYTSEPSDYAAGDTMDAGTFESYKSSFNWWSDNNLQSFLDNNKPVVIVHYKAGRNDSKNSCDFILNKYKDRYNSEKISFICESKSLKRYVHYEVTPSDPTASPTDAPTKKPSTNSPTRSQSKSPTKAPAIPSNDPLELFPSKLVTQTGYQSSDQSIEVLQTNELTGTKDNWDTYIEIGKETGSSLNPYKGVFRFDVPEGSDLSAYTSLKLTVNYYGPGNDGGSIDKRWQFQIRRNDTKKWVTLGNSGSMQDWIWSLVEFPLPSGVGLTDLADGNNRIRVRVRTIKDNNDIADIDYLKLSIE